MLVKLTFCCKFVNIDHNLTRLDRKIPFCILTHPESSLCGFDLFANEGVSIFTTHQLLTCPPSAIMIQSEWCIVSRCSLWKIVWSASMKVAKQREKRKTRDPMDPTTSILRHPKVFPSPDSPPLQPARLLPFVLDTSVISSVSTLYIFCNWRNWFKCFPKIYIFKL